MMSPNDRDHAIERYLSGKMSPAEEQNLHRLAASDPELKRALRVELSIRRAFAADRAAVPVEDPHTRASLVAALGSLGTAGAAGTASAAPAAGFLAGGFAKILGVGVVALGLGSSAYFLPGMIDSEPGSPAMGTSAPALIATPAPAAPSALQVSDTLTAATQQPEVMREISSAPEPAAAPVADNTPEVVEQPAAPSRPATTQPAPKARDTAETARPVVVASDSVRVKVNLNLEGLE